MEKNNSTKVLSNVYWFDGAACSGKFTYAHLLSQEFNFIHFQQDNYLNEYFQKATMEKQPALFKIWKEKDN